MAITLQPAVLRWARERASLSQAELAKKMSVKPERVAAWEQSGEISVSQARRLAKKTYTPEGFLYLRKPPDERLPIQDFRTVGDAPPRRPSPDLLETVYAMQRRQAWMSEEVALYYEEAPLQFVGAYSDADAPDVVAAAMRETLGLQRGWAASQPNLPIALRFLRDRIEAAGVMAVVNGVVGNNTSRKLDLNEFRGFALVDEYAPLIFVNNADYKAAQMFTMAHELAHIFVGETGVSNADETQSTSHKSEIFCNSAAAEFLAPADEFADVWRGVRESDAPFQDAARHFKVSAIVAARRALDLRLIDRPKFNAFYQDYQGKTSANAKETAGGGAGGGGDFWSTQNWRISRRFASAVVCAVGEGRLLYREAYSLTGLNGRNFAKLPGKMGIIQ